MTFPGAFAKGEGFQPTPGQVGSAAHGGVSPRFRQQPSSDSRIPSDSFDLHSSELRGKAAFPSEVSGYSFLHDL